MPPRRNHCTPDDGAAHPCPAAVICDLDGTLVDSGLDFSAIRAAIGLPADTSIMEALSGMSPEQRVRGQGILERYEHAGAQRARLLPGVAEFLALADSLGLRRGLFTRNSRDATALTLRRCGLAFDRVLTRDDGPVKPHPWAIREMCTSWGITPQQALVFGDFHYDLAAGRAAGAVNVLVCHGQVPKTIRGYELADCFLASFNDHPPLVRLLKHGRRDERND